ncbi:MAG: hypothetical protein GF307_11835 [candidate division Zixibacteria bacterium]|nr:hypothetical protein [candidate division Zixibacteria bacterium]
MEYLKSIITEEGINFKELFDPRDTKIIMVVTFIALLELTRLHYISIRQNMNYGEIWIYRR